MNDKNILFVINLLSGVRKERQFLIDAIKKLFPESDIFVLKNKNDFAVCLNKAKEEQYKCIVISGGDGTINSFLPVLIEQKKILGILPSGSGNGLARTLGIPLNPVKALDLIKQCNVKKTDVGKLVYIDNNEYRYFSCAVGFGVDADIAHRFEQQKIRGLAGYIISSVKEFITHKSKKIQVSIDDKIFLNNNFLIFSIMNIPQYGNNFYVSPSAMIDDSVLNIVVLDKINIFLYPVVLWNLIMKKEKWPLRYYVGKKIKIDFSHKLQRALHYHIDGEPCKITNKTKIEIEILEKELQVITLL